MTNTFNEIKIRSLYNKERTPIENIGGKAWHLSFCASNGFPVPPGIVLPVSFLNQGEKAIAENIEVILKSLLEVGPGPYAVRSSAISEDGTEHSFAGQFATVLNVITQDEIHKAILEVLRSASAAQVKNYQSDSGGKMAIVIQQMIHSDYSGVAFSANPVTGERNAVVINAVKGLGERLVSGSATPDEIEVRGNEIKKINLIENVLSDVEILQIAETAKSLEKILNSPQDIEWAFEKGKFFLLQSRSITALPDEPVPAPVNPPPGPWMRDDHAPLTSEFTSRVWFDVYGKAMGDALREMGVPAKELRFAKIGGQTYTRFMMEGEGEKGSAKMPPKFILWLASRLAPPFIKAKNRAKKAFNEKTYRKYITRWDNEWKQFFKENFNKYHPSTYKNLSIPELLIVFGKLRELMTKSAEVHAVLGIAHFMTMGEFAVFCKKELGWANEKIFPLFSGMNSATSAASREINELCRKHFTKTNASGNLKNLEISSKQFLIENTAFSNDLDTWIYNNGHRMQYYDAAAPTLGEQPEVIFQNIKSALNSLNEDKKQVDPQVELTKNEIESARKILKTKGLDSTFDELFHWARKGYFNRDENGAETATSIGGLLRLCCLEIARRPENNIAHPFDIFHLSPDEFISFLTGNFPQFEESVRIRKGHIQWAKFNRGPKTYGPPQPPMMDSTIFPSGLREVFEILGWMFEVEMNVKPKFAPADKTLTGTGVYAGSYEGTARVINEAKDFHLLQPGEILVCRITSGEWSILFSRVGALVTEEGGMLSHPAIIAREFRIPAVVGAGEEVSKIKSGQRLRVDGATGIINLLN